MLLPDDEELVSGDPALPGLALLLDPDALREHVARAVPDLVGVEVCYLRYKPGTSVVAGLDVKTTHGAWPAMGKSVRPEGTGKLGKTSAYAARRGGDSTLVLGRDRTLVVAPATADRRLPGAALVLGDPDALLGSPGGGARTEVLRYKPERRLVARLSRAGEALAVARALQPGRLGVCLDAARAMGRAGLPVAPVLGRSRRRGWLLSAYLEGDPVAADAGEDLMAQTGDLLARWHATAPWRRIDHAGWRHSADDAVRGIAAIRPGAAPAARAVVLAAAQRLNTSARRAVVVHGDFSADQMVHRDGGLHVLDLDRVRVDDPVVDVASWWADGAAAGGSAQGRPGGPAASADAAGPGTPAAALAPLLDAYRVRGGADLHVDLDDWCALALLSRAVLPFRGREPGWARRTDELVATASALAGTS